MAIMHGAEPFFLPGGRRGVLLVHGFTGSPAEMRLFGEFLQARGFTVFSPRLCGHGTSVADMAETAWPQWYGSVEDGYHLLAAHCDKVCIAGLSMGGLLALKLAAEYPVSKIALLSTPVFLTEKRLPLLPLFRLFRNVMPKKRRRMDVPPIYSVAYDQVPLRSLESLLALIKHVDSLLTDIIMPTLIIQSRVEHTVLPASALYLYNRLGSSDKTLHWLERSGHIVTLDTEREQVFQAVADFFV